MPGLVGFTFESQEVHQAQVLLERMRISLVHREESVLDELFIAELTAATRVHPDVIQKQPQASTCDGVSVWMDGEFNNRDELARHKKLDVSSDSELLLARSLTLEIWLQQVYAGRFRDFESPLTCDESMRRTA